MKKNLFGIQIVIHVKYAQEKCQFGTRLLKNVKLVLINIQFSTTLHMNVQENCALQAKDGISIR